MVEFLNPTYEIDIAVTGTQAAEFVAAHPPDIAIVDMHLPGISGATLVRMLRGTSGLAHIPILVLSVDSAFQNILNAIDAGSDEFMRKNDVSRKSLLEAIDRICSSRVMIREEERKPSPTADIMIAERKPRVEELIGEIKRSFRAVSPSAQGRIESLMLQAVALINANRSNS